MNSAARNAETCLFAANPHPIQASNQPSTVNGIKKDVAPLPGKRPTGKPPPPKPSKQPKHGPVLQRGGRVGQSQSGSRPTLPMPVTEQEGIM